MQKPNHFNLFWVLHHSKHVFYLQKVGEINGIQVPFTLSISMQYQSMLAYGHNGTISMVPHLAQMM
jgi:hypothetical protein